MKGSLDGFVLTRKWESSNCTSSTVLLISWFILSTRPRDTLTQAWREGVLAAASCLQLVVLILWLPSSPPHAFWGVKVGAVFSVVFFFFFFLFKILLKEWQPYFKHCCVTNTATNSTSAECLRAYGSSKHGIEVCLFWCIYYISGFAWRAKEYKRIFLGQYCKTYLLLSHPSSLRINITRITYT